MKIKEVEAITGITKQNIRYYERQGLLNPGRDKENDYREYSEEDLRTLKLVKLFRKLDMPIEEIRKLLQEKAELQSAVSAQKERLKKEQERLEGAIAFCGKIAENNIGTMDVDHYLQEMEQEERSGAVFADWIQDYKKVVQAEGVRRFTFAPDNMCLNAQEFTESLLQYAKENNLDLCMTKEGMKPEFTINGIEYEAVRYFGRFGAVVHCTAKHPEELIPAGMTKKRYSTLQWVFWSIPVVIVLFLLVVANLGQPLGVIVPVVISIGLLSVALAVHNWYLYHNMR